ISTPEDGYRAVVYGLDQTASGKELPLPPELDAQLLKAGLFEKMVAPWVELREGMVAIRPLPEGLNEAAVRRAIIRLIKDALGSARASKYNMTPGGLTTINITRRGVDKGFAMRDAIAFWKLDPDKVFYFGDEYNNTRGADSPVTKIKGVHCLAVCPAWDEDDAVRIGNDYRTVRKFLAALAARLAARPQVLQTTRDMEEALAGQALYVSGRKIAPQAIAEGRGTFALLKPD
ncbi:MAG: HAD hydrolase family protein, partial [Candidatus Omnitrophica bacterium]|nr:HAD hydrolase family protein [Candidatus Omnitrophota bacterium]